MVVPKGASVGEHYAPLSRRAFFVNVPTKMFKERKETSVPSKRELSLLLSYIIIYTDRNSPFYTETDIRQRERQCMQALVINSKTMVWRMIRERHWYYNMLLTCYLKFSQPLFSAWLSVKTSLDLIEEQLRSPLDTADMEKDVDNRTKWAEKTVKMIRDLMALEKELFRDEDTSELVSETVTADRGMGGYAELYALEFPN